MAASDMEDGEVRHYGPPAPDLISDNETMEHLSAAEVVYQDHIEAQQLGFPRQKADPRGRKPQVIEATAADWNMPFPLSDGSDGEPANKAQDRDDEQSEAELTEAEEPLQEGSSRSPPWLQRAPYEMDNKYAG
jgi:hypothetical protein